MVYLVTGGTGFIGAHVIRQLTERGDSAVSYDLAPNPTYLESVVGPKNMPAVKVVQGDVTDLGQLLRAGRGQGVQKVIHLAYMLGRDTEFNPSLATKVNCEGTNNVFDAACEWGARRVVWASSIAVFGPHSAGAGGVVANDAAYDPRVIYGACKVVNEVVARRYSHSYGLEPVGLRFPVVYGPGAVRGWSGFLTRLVMDLAQGRPAQAPTGQQPSNWLHVEDIAEAAVLTTTTPHPGELAYTLSGEVKTTREVVDMVLGYFPDSPVTFDESYPDPSLPGHLDSYSFRRDLGWEPRFTMADGIAHMVNFYR
ncbi:MAG: NAD(P)-dependent oxidoreductase [Dehalococcoidia bacterium]|jgi:nucleoside-diphosphate-sugar epimerase|nr:NAD(P)-dependent oxidoreductase [Dehalococcoidia bacterium]MDP7240601.1 NAD(P)-dependent oxidoreductase [Dehalococcoidia bacterium]